MCHPRPEGVARAPSLLCSLDGASETPFGGFGLTLARDFVRAEVLPLPHLGPSFQLSLVVVPDALTGVAPEYDGRDLEQGDRNEHQRG